MRATFADAKAQIASILGLTTTDPAVMAYANRATERLMHEGPFVGTVLRYQICTTNKCITWPRQIETIEAIAVCRYPMVIRNSWFEFLNGGVGVVKDGDRIGFQMIDREQACAFDDITGTGKQIRVYADLAVDAGKTILFQGVDNNGNWILTNNGDTNGESVTLVAPPNYAVTTHASYWSAMTAVQKVATKGYVRVYEYDPVAGTMKALAVYEPDETRPTYRRSYIPDLPSGTGGTCSDSQVDVRAKMRFMPITQDTDWLQIQHVDALAKACKAIWYEDNNLPAEFMNYYHGFVDPVTKTRIGGAIELLQKQLAHFQGSGEVPTLRVQNTQEFGGGNLNALDLQWNLY